LEVGVAQPAALVERRDRVMVITLNRPEARNAVNSEVTSIVGSALDEADRDNGVWVVIITGAGDQSFCAGADLKAIMRGEAIIPPNMEHWSFAGWVNHFVSKPTIAAVNGFALGGGTEIVLASDLAVAARSATFGLPEVSRGIIAAAAGAFRLPAQLPRKRGMQMLLTGEPIDAATALDYGLINEVVPDGGALDAALALAERICRNAPLAVQASKRIAYGAADGSWAGEERYWEITAAENARVRQSEDGREGPRAFAEKRQPVWQAR
jgi:crotonobetainyl-CoA hydratase